MIIRNLILVSMIFFASPTICTISEVNLATQDQEKIIGWTQIVKSLSPKVQELIKNVISLHKDITAYQLNNVHVDDLCLNELCDPTCKIRLFEGMNILLRYIKRGPNSNVYYAGISEGLTRTQSIWQARWQKINELRSQLNNEEQATEETARLTGELWIPIIIGDSELRQLLAGKTVTENDMATMKKILALYSFALECF